MSENRISKYLIYALGEITLVVIGILIALQINNANERYKSEQRNFKTLMSLEEELRSNQSIINENLNTVRDQISYSLFHIDTLSNPDYEMKDWEAYFLRSQNDLGPLTLNSISTTSLNELISSGGYSEIVSDSIKSSILLYQSQISDQANRIKAFKAYWNNIELPYVIENHSLLDMWVRGQHINMEKTEKDLERSLPAFRNDISYFQIPIEAYRGNRVYANMYIIRFFELNRVLLSMEELMRLVKALSREIETFLNS